MMFIDATLSGRFQRFMSEDIAGLDLRKAFINRVARVTMAMSV